MTAERDLATLLTRMSPELSQTTYVFCSFQHAQYGDHRELSPVAAIQESEGLTLIIPQHKADEHRVAYDNTFKRISLGVHSSLDAVGLTAAFSSKLAQHGLSANVVAGYYHDHIYVHSALAEQALAVLNQISSRGS
ncbi:Uncharacterised protein [Halioglobus japonicus]|nr:Uncharacterised protein [Halioglobus japonicus]